MGMTSYIEGGNCFLWQAGNSVLSGGQRGNLHVATL